MREHLLGYLLEALEPTEHDLVAVRLNEDPRLQAELVCLREKLEPLAADARPHEPPAGLADRTCGYVAAVSGGAAGPGAANPGTGGPGSWANSPSNVPSAAGCVKRPAVAAPASAWRMQDLLVAGGIAIAACMLVFPAIAASRFDARRNACQNNLRSVGMALSLYSDVHGGHFPLVPLEGPLSVAGMYAPTLLGLGYLDSPSWLICPGSSAAERGELLGQAEFIVPTLEQLQAAGPQELVRLQQWMGGDYGYLLGYYENGVYRGHKNRGRATFPLMADAPQKEQPGCRSANHECRGQNVLFGDFHVAFLTNCCLDADGDHIYHNAHGYIGAGANADDAVIARSGTRVIWFTVELGQ
jgi:hypothetical protein